MAGWIKIDRKIQDHWLWDDKPFSRGQAWIDLILLANHKDSDFVSGLQTVHGKRGTLYRSYSFLAKRWGWDRRKVTRFLNALEMDGMISQNGTTHGTTVTLINYDKFQGNGTTNRTTNGQPMVQPVVQPMVHIQEDKKDTTYLKERKEGGTAANSPSGVEGQGQGQEEKPFYGEEMDENGFRTYKRREDYW